MNLTIRCVDTAESFKLALVLERVAYKILKLPQCVCDAGDGHGLVAGRSRNAVSWETGQAADWKRDKAFIQYLGVNAVNTPRERS